MTRQKQWDPETAAANPPRPSELPVKSRVSPLSCRRRTAWVQKLSSIESPWRPHVCQTMLLQPNRHRARHLSLPLDRDSRIPWPTSPRRRHISTRTHTVRPTRRTARPAFTISDTTLTAQRRAVCRPLTSLSATRTATMTRRTASCQWRRWTN